MTDWLQKLKSGLRKSSAGLSSGIDGIFRKRKIDRETLDELEELLICSDIGTKASARIIKNFAAKKMNKDAGDKEIKIALAEEISTILSPCEKKFNLPARPTVILMVGVNGAGKTTAIGKLAAKFKQNRGFGQETSQISAYDLKKNGFNEEDTVLSTERKTGAYKEVREDLDTGKVPQIPASDLKKNGFNEEDTVLSTERKTGAYKEVREDLSTGKVPQIPVKTVFPQISFIAGDTFRAAAVEQLDEWGRRNGIRVYKGAPGCDAAGLCFDGLKEALKLGDDIVFIDTAGRLQNKTGLMDELKKVVKVIQKVIPGAPHHTLLCLDATTGQNALNQVKTFKEMINVDGLIINKLDGTAKGGILVAVAEETPTPVYFIGVGERIDDINTFNAKDFAANLLDL